MLFAEFSPEGWAVVIGAIFLGIAQTLNIVFTYLTKRSSAVNAKKIDAVQATQATAGQVEGVRILVNGNMTQEKRINAQLARKIATLTGKSADVQAAVDAEDRLALHLTREQESKLVARPGTEQSGGTIGG